MNILFDTHIWLWWINQSSELKQPHLELLEMAEALYISAISCWEVTQLIHRQKIVLPIHHQHWFQLALEAADIQCLPVTQRIAIRSAELPEPHRDPADQFIIETALEHQLFLMSFDEKFPSFQTLQALLLPRKLPDKPV